MARERKEEEQGKIEAAEGGQRRADCCDSSCPPIQPLRMGNVGSKNSQVLEIQLCRLSRVFPNRGRKESKWKLPTFFSYQFPSEILLCPFSLPPAFSLASKLSWIKEVCKSCHSHVDPTIHVEFVFYLYLQFHPSYQQVLVPLEFISQEVSSP